MSPLTGWPSRLEGPMAWDGSTYKENPELYTYKLSQDNLADIKKALDHFKSLGLSRGHLTRDTFPLSEELSSLLAKVNDTMNNGRGFQVIHGIDPTSFSEEDHVLIFAGIASHIASNRASWIDHIIHAKEDESKGTHNLRPNELQVEMDFHTDSDSGNVMSLFTVSKAEAGGEQFLSSFWRIYNHLADKSPHTLAELAADWYWEKPDVASPIGEIVNTNRALIGIVDGKAEINYGRSFVAGHVKYPMSADAPPLTEAQRTALDVLREVAREHSFKLETKVGDLLFVNNLSIMHARSAFQDGAGSQAARHLVRLHMKDLRSWPTAPSLKYFDNDVMWSKVPEEQKLPTVSEWMATPREIRVVGSSQITNNHD